MLFISCKKKSNKINDIDDGSWDDDGDDVVYEKECNNVPGEKFFMCLDLCVWAGCMCDISPSSHGAMCATELYAYFCLHSLIINNRYEGFWMWVCVFFGSLKSDTAHTSVHIAFHISGVNVFVPLFASALITSLAFAFLFTSRCFLAISTLV